MQKSEKRFTVTQYLELELYIGGQWKKASGQPVLNPADESVLGTVPSATRSDLDTALAAAADGFKTWSKTSPAKRTEIILKATALMRERVEEMAVAMTLEQGKPIAQSRLEILRGCEIIEWDAMEGRRTYGRIIPSEPGMKHMVLRQPIGVVAAFSPWNFPMSSPARKVGGALSAGCSIILKASEETPAGAVQLVRAFHDAGLPRGVLNLVFGKPSEISEYLIPQDLGAADHVHRLDSCRQAACRDGRPLYEACDHGAWRPCAGHRLRRRRPGRDRGNFGDRKVAQCRPGLRVADAVFRPGGDLQEIHRSLRREGQGDEGRRRSRPVEPDGAARQSSPHRGDGHVRRRRQSEGRAASCRRRADRQPRLLFPADVLADCRRSACMPRSRSGRWR